MKGTNDKSKADDLAQGIFLQMDKNKDGVLSASEFVNGALACPDILKILEGK